MNRSCLIALLILICPVFVLAQQKKHRKNVKYDEATELALFRKHEECFYYPTYTTAQRRNFYPFNKAAKIELLGTMAPEDQLIIEGDVAATNAAKKPLFQKNEDGSYQVNRLRVEQSVILNSPQVDSLTNMLYNYGYTPVGRSVIAFTDDPTGCYQPRNAIIFIGDNGHIIEYIEYCFSCFKTKTSSDKIEAYTFCDSKLSLIKKFFLNQGIQIGTITP